jgi:uncharacterized protein (DUF58 family)
MAQRRSLAVRPAIAFLLALVLVTPPAMLRGNNLLLLMMALVVGAAVAAFIGPRLTLHGMRVRRLLPRHGQAGSPLRIRYRVQRRAGRGIPAFAVGISEDLQGVPVEIEHPAWILHVAPGDTVHGDLALVPTRRGRLILNEARINTSFPFGLFNRQRVVAGRREIVVHPRAMPLRHSLLRAVRGSGLDGPRSSQQRGAGEEWFGTRAVRPGDRLRDIAWRISAHRDELIALERSGPQPPRLRVVLDLRRATAQLDEPDLEQGRALEEKAIELAASLLQAGHESGDEIGLCVLGLEAAAHDPRRGSLHLDRMLTTLAMLRLDDARVPSKPPTGERSGVVVVQPDRVRPVSGMGSVVHLSARQWSTQGTGEVAA